jgi:hypothetical protein
VARRDGSVTRDRPAARLSQALVAALRASIGEQRFGLDGRLVSWSHALVPGVDLALLPRGLNGVDGARLRQADSAAALALNSFLNWRRCPQLLRIAGESGFRELRFEARCPTGVRGTPPLLDLIAASDTTIVAVTARCAEYLGRRHARLAPAYDAIRLAPAMVPWVELLRRLRREPGLFRHVDASALLKHAIGLGQTFPDRAVKLAYLFWEPVDAARFEPFRVHRSELAWLVALVDGAAVRLVAQSFDDLWSEWQALAEPAWLREIVARLKIRYGVAIAGAAGL